MEHRPHTNSQIKVLNGLINNLTADHIGYTVEKEVDMYKIIFDDGNIKMVVGTDLTLDECNDIINRQLEPSFYKIVQM